MSALPPRQHAEPIAESTWIDLGYPSWLARALSEYNEDCFFNPGVGESINAERARTMDTEDLLEVAMSWNGMIGFARQVAAAVRFLDARYREPGQ